MDFSSEKYSSFVNRFHVLIKECREDESPNAKKTSILFKVYEELLEHFGIYKEIMTEIRNGLMDAVYSEKLTTIDGEEPCIERIPYFQLVTKIEREATTVSDSFQLQLDIVQEKLFNKQMDYEKVVQDMALLTEAMNQLRDENVCLENTIESKNNDIERIYDEMAAEKRKFQNKETKMQNEIDELNKELNKVRRERDSLQPYKDGFDKMKIDFEIKNKENTLQPVKKPVLSSRKANVITNIEAAMRLKEQLLQTENKILEDYEKHIERHREKISIESGQTFTDKDSGDIEEELTEASVEEADIELVDIQTNFRRNCKDIDRELLSLERHCDMLKEQLQTMEEFKLKEKNEGRELFKAIAQGKYKGGRPGEDGDLADDPFTVKERVLSKYSSALYVSYNNGKSFLEIDENIYCRSCGDKTLICPHKVTRDDRILKLPKGATHIKFSRPPVNINQTLIDRTLGLIQAMIPEQKSKEATETSLTKTVKSDSEEKSKPELGLVDLEEEKPLSDHQDEKLGQSLSEKEPSSERVQSTKTTSTDHSKSLENEETEEDIIGLNSFDVLWEDFNIRCPHNRKSPREIDDNRVKSIVEQFWATILWEDNNTSKYLEENNLLDKFYIFMEKRFQLKDISLMVMADFFTTFIEKIKESQTLRCFAHILVNNLDGASFRYLLIVYDLVDELKWVHVEQFRWFLSILYPFLNDDDIESIQLGYISYCENKVSKKSICNYIAYLLLKGREPRFVEMENRLSESHHIGGYMKQQDFALFMETIIEEVDMRLTLKLFQQTSCATIGSERRAEGMVNVQKLSQIGSYLSILITREKMLHDIRSKMEESLLKQSEDHEDEYYVNPSILSEVPDFHLKWTYTNFIKLSNDIARSQANRNKISDSPPRNF